MIRVVGDSRHLPQLLDVDATEGQLDVNLPRPGTVPCVVGSPPYNVAIPNYPSGYHDHLHWPLYKAYAFQWAKAIAGVLCPGGRAWVNVQQTVPRNTGEPGGPRINLAHLWMSALAASGLEYRDTVLWVQDSFDGGCAWGSWCQPSAPNLRGSSELILLYFKPPWKRPAPDQWKGVKLPKEELGGSWEDLARNVWKINPANPGTWHTKDPETGKRVPPRKNLPALFPIELPARAIRLSTWPGEWVVDPWAGHCTTGRAADELGRQSVMIDVGFDEEGS